MKIKELIKQPKKWDTKNIINKFKKKCNPIFCIFKNINKKTIIETNIV